MNNYLAAIYRFGNRLRDGFKIHSFSNRGGQQRRRTNRIARRGATTVEMALVAPFVILLVLGSIELTRMMMLKQSLTNAAREGCRFATLGTTQNHEHAENYSRQRLRGVVSDYENEGIVQISVFPEFQAAEASGVVITTSVSVDCADVSWLPPMFFAGAEIRASASMRRE